MDENREFSLENDVEFTPQQETALHEIEEFCSNGNNCDDPPATNKLQVKVGYENDLLGKFSGSHDDAKSYIESTFVHVQTYYCHSTWVSKIKLERIGEIIHINQSFGGHELYSAK